MSGASLQAVTEGLFFSFKTSEFAKETVMLDRSPRSIGRGAAAEVFESAAEVFKCCFQFQVLTLQGVANPI